MTCRRRNPAEETEIKSLTASSDYHLMWPLPRYHACNVLDSGDCIWNAGKHPPASIQIKLTDGPQHVTHMELQTEMSPLRAFVHHVIKAGKSQDTMRVAGCIRGPVSHGEWIHVAVNDDAQFINIATIESPSYVAWKNIRVYGKTNPHRHCDDN